MVFPIVMGILIHGFVFEYVSIVAYEHCYAVDAVQLCKYVG